PARRGLGGPGVERARGGASGERAGRADRGRRVPCRAGRRGGGRGPGGAGVVGRRGPGPSPGGRPPALRVDPAGVRRARDALGPVTSPAPEPDAAALPPHRPGRSGWKTLAAGECRSASVDGDRDPSGGGESRARCVRTGRSLAAHERATTAVVLWRAHL